MKEIGLFLIFVSLSLFLVGLFFIFLPKIPLLGKLPGDILIKRDNFVFFFPLITSILLSIIFSLIFFLLNRIR